MDSFHTYNASDPTACYTTKDSTSFVALVNTYFPVLCHFAYSIIKDQEAAKDIVQEVFVRYWKGNEAFDEFNKLKGWLYQSTRNRCLNELRSRQRSTSHHSAYPSQEISENNILSAIVKAETLASIYSVISELPEQMRNVFEMHYLEGMPIREIAAKLGITSKTVSNHRYNALSILRAKLANDAEAFVLLWLITETSAKTL